MEIDFSLKTTRVASWILIFCVLGAILITIIPLVSVQVNDTSGNTIQVYHNLETLLKSNSNTIRNIGNNLNLIVLLFWIVMIICIISFFGAILCTNEKLQIFGQILLLIGCFSTIFSVLITYFQWSLIKSLDSINGVSATSVFGLDNPLKYIYISLIVTLSLVVFTAIYTKSIAPLIVKDIIKSMKNKKIENKDDGQISLKKPSMKKDHLLSNSKEPLIIDNKPRPSIPIVAKDEVDDFEKEPEIDKTLFEEGISDSENKENTIEDEIISEPKKPLSKEDLSNFEKVNIDQPISKDKKASPFPIEPELKQSEGTGEVQPSPLFEKALLSAIEKKQVELTNDEKNVNSNKIINVKCPSCQNIFCVEKSKDKTKIECPKCGKKGVTK